MLWFIAIPVSAICVATLVLIIEVIAEIHSERRERCKN